MTARKIYGLFVVMAIIIVACNRDITRIEPDLPDNPFIINDSGEVIVDVPVDSASFLGLHKYIFSTTCAVPGCHDGTFEPDFRTVHSSYNSLVFAPVIKNDDEGTFTYRVLPGDTALSWLHERITTDDPVLGRMPLYDTLYPEEREKITAWILNGAEDVFGNSPTLPDYQPTTYGYIAYLNDTAGVRIDTNRADFIQPIVLPTSTSVQFWFGLFDTDEAGVFQLPSAMEEQFVRISQDIYMQTDYTEIPFSLMPDLTPWTGPSYYDPDIALPYWHYFSINTADYETGKLYFMRAYLRDNAHPFYTDIPDDSQLYIQYYFSFIIQ